jgi:hypothetical protein
LAVEGHRRGNAFTCRRNNLGLALVVEPSLSRTRKVQFTVKQTFRELVAFCGMSMGHFFRDKAAECAVLADSASEPQQKQAYEDMRRAWLQLAARADALADEPRQEVRFSTEAVA